MKHVKLFENFMEDTESGKIVIGVISEGCDVAVFPKKIGEEVWAHLSSLESGYYKPFRFDLDPNEPFYNSGKLFLVVNASSLDMDFKGGGFPHQNLGSGVTVGIVDAWHLSQSQGNETPISVYQAPPVNPALEGGIESSETYALELVGGDKYMSAQSWGQELENGAYEHFMSIENDLPGMESMWEK